MQWPCVPSHAVAKRNRPSPIILITHSVWRKPLLRSAERLTGDGAAAVPAGIHKEYTSSSFAVIGGVGHGSAPGSKKERAVRQSAAKRSSACILADMGRKSIMGRAGGLIRIDRPFCSMWCLFALCPLPPTRALATETQPIFWALIFMILASLARPSPYGDLRAHVLFQHRFRLGDLHHRPASGISGARSPPRRSPPLPLCRGPFRQADTSLSLYTARNAGGETDDATLFHRGIYRVGEDACRCPETSAVSRAGISA